MKPAHLKALCIFLTGFTFTACGESGYYYQAARGQISLILKRKPIKRLLNSSETPEALKERLRLVERIQEFAGKELLLPVNNSFTSLVNLPTRHVIWNVYAAPELSVTPERWCFPIAGCVSYRGYFSRAGAETYASQYSGRGYDVYIGGSAAFSTLGWFDDPLLSTFLGWPEESLAGLIFHELAHARIYIKDDSSFNESFAMTVENEGVRRWLDAAGKPEHFEKFLMGRRRSEEFNRLMLKTRDSLKEEYLSRHSNGEKRANKKSILKNARDEYERLKAGWGGDGRWDSWVNKGLNNAKLASIATYNSFVPAFTIMLREKKSIEEFYEAVEELARLPEEKRELKLKSQMPIADSGKSDEP